MRALRNRRPRSLQSGVRLAAARGVFYLIAAGVSPLGYGEIPTVEFAPATSHDISGTLPQDIAVADFNQDLHLDMAITGSGSDGDEGVSVLLGDGSGGFLSSSSFGAGVSPWGLGTGDFNGDEIADLAVTQGTQTKVWPDPYCGAEIGVPVYLGQGGGGFTFSTCLIAGLFPVGVVVGDFNEDDKVDLAVANNVTEGLSIFLGFGNGTFSAAQHVPGAAGLSATDIVGADFNGDGHWDLAVSHYSGVRVFLGSGDGGFAESSAAGGSLLTEAVAAGDLNGDAVPDIASVELYQSRLLVSIGNGDGTFQAPLAYVVGAFPRDVAVADINGDGRVDVVVASEIIGSAMIFLGTCDGTLFAPQSFLAGLQPMAVSVLDLNEDSHPDLALANRNFGEQGTVSLLIQVGGEGPIPSGIPGDINGDCRVDLIDFTTFARCFGLTAPIPNCNAGEFAGSDMDDNGEVNLNDFFTFVTNFTG